MGLLPADKVGADASTFPLFRCPLCKTSGVIDEDQFHGRISIWCDCGYHASRDWSQERPE